MNGKIRTLKLANKDIFTTEENQLQYQFSRPKPLAVCRETIISGSLKRCPNSVRRLPPRTTVTMPIKRNLSSDWKWQQFHID